MSALISDFDNMVVVYGPTAGTTGEHEFHLEVIKVRDNPSYPMFILDSVSPGSHMCAGDDCPICVSDIYKDSRVDRVGRRKPKPAKGYQPPAFVTKRGRNA